jgi:nicotinamidase-related amidase
MAGERKNMAMTMLQMAGAAPTPATMADGVLLIIDAQREYTDGLMPLTGVAAAVEALAELLEKARGAGAPIMHVRHQAKGRAFNPSSSGYEIVSALTPRPGETIVDKGLPNAFAGTDLAKHLAASGRKNLIVGGFMTHMCVSATIRSATDHGFMSTVAADTVATRDLPDATNGGIIAADAINRITLAALSDRFAWIVPKAAQIA